MERELVVALAIGVVAGIALIVWLYRFVGMRLTRYRALVFGATLLTFVVVVVGAYVRLSDAGLGCPDWPGCYGHLDVPKNAAEQAAADARYPHMPVDAAKGWKEMGHRYIAGILGLLLAAIALVGTMRQRAFGQSAWLPLALVFVVLWQAALGRWTVTLLLKPVIVTLHLVGGMTILALLAWLAARQVPALRTPFRAPPGLRPFAALVLVAICVQIVLGGWVSTNYAALACTDLPLCKGSLVPEMDMRNAFHVLRELGQTPEGDLLSNEALTAIHWMHRLGAIVVAALALWLAARLVRVRETAPLGWAIGAIVCMQFTLGLLNVVFSLPLPLAAAHNGGAALLLATAVVINFRLSASRVTVNRDVPMAMQRVAR